MYRSSLLVPESSVLQMTPETGLHPVMTGFKSIYDDAKLAVIQNVGYPNHNRSHFRSMDIWDTASKSDEFLTTGWLGRYFESKYSGYSTSCPNINCPDPFAITVDSVVSNACQGQVGNLSVVLTNPNNLQSLNDEYEEPAPSSCFGNELQFLRQTILDTNQYLDTIQTASSSATNLVNYPNGNELAKRLQVVARLIAGGLQTKVYVVRLEGFDTHAQQVDSLDKTQGYHPNLLRTLSDAVGAFQQDLQLMGIAERVIGMTYSEFGRRIYANASRGTDHGKAAPILLFGSCVNGGVFNDNPEIPSTLDPDLDIEMDIDFRNIYGSILMDWFKVPEVSVKNLLFEEFEYMPLISCNGDIAQRRTDDNDDEKFILNDTNKVALYPNPTRGELTIDFGKIKAISVSIYAVSGQELMSIQGAEGIKKINTSTLKNGWYLVKTITTNQEVITQQFMKH